MSEFEDKIIGELPPEPKTPVKTPEEVDKEEDDFLSKLESGKKYGDEEEAPKEAPKAEAKSDPEESEEEATPEEEDDGVKAEDYERALKAIRRDGIDPDSLRWGRKRLVEHGLKRAEHYAKQEKSWQETQAKLKELEERASKEKESAAATPADDPFELNGTLDPFKEEFGEESVGALRKALEAVHGKSAGRIKELETQLEAVQRQTLLGLFESARTRLQTRFRDLEDSETWQEVGRKAATFMETGEYESIDSAVLDAAKVLGLGEKERADAARRKGSPSGKGRKATQSSSKTSDEIEDDLLAELESKHGYLD